jgi:ATP-dependent DNA ligase
MLAYKDGPRVRLISRQNVDHTERFRDLAASVAALKAPTLILDGDVCVFDKHLVSQFHLLGNTASEEPYTPPVFMVFDCVQSTASTSVGCHCIGAATCSRRRSPARIWSTPPVACPTTAWRRGL